MYVFSLDRDSVVIPNNTQSFVKNANSKVSHTYFENQKYKVCYNFEGEHAADVDHLGAEIMANVFAMKFIESEWFKLKHHLKLKLHEY